jgi:hypothetical protein
MLPSVGGPSLLDEDRGREASLCLFLRLGLFGLDGAGLSWCTGLRMIKRPNEDVESNEMYAELMQL